MVRRNHTLEVGKQGEPPTDFLGQRTCGYAAARRCPTRSMWTVLSIPEAHERDECRGDGVQRAQKRSARDRVIYVAAVQ